MDATEHLSEPVIRELLAGGRFACRSRGLDIDDVVRAIASELPRIASRPPVLSMVGGAASGKSTLARRLAAFVGGHAEILSTDDFVIGTREFRRTHWGEDDPLRKYDFQQLNATVRKLCALEAGESAEVPIYRRENGAGVPGADAPAEASEYAMRPIVGLLGLLIVEGDFQPLKKTDLLIYLHVPDGQRLQNRLWRDVGSKGYATEREVRESFASRQRSQHRLFTLPAAAEADLLLVVEGDASGPDDPYRYDLY